MYIGFKEWQQLQREQLKRESNKGIIARVNQKAKRTKSKKHKK